MMANPESTQQLRDRDLEFMFYDEAQVGVLLLLLLLLLLLRAGGAIMVNS